MFGVLVACAVLVGTTIVRRRAEREGLSEREVGRFLMWVLLFRRHAAPDSTWKCVDSFAYAFPFDWLVGRAGCFVAFDHPGRATTFLLGQAYKDGVVRHNLGLDEAIYTVLLAALFHLLGRRPRAPGFFLGLFMILYAPFRFSADFLRIVDVRYQGLTPGQYGCIALALAGAAILITRRHVKMPVASA